MANPRKPTALKILQGTQQKCRTNPDEPVASTSLPVAPGYFTDAQVEQFSMLVALVDGLNIASSVDVGMLADLAIVECEIADDAVLLATEGPYYVPSKESGIIRAHPAVARMTANRQRAQALRNEFGLSPAARSKVSAGPKTTANPFAALHAGRDNPYARFDKKSKMLNPGDKYDRYN